METGNTIKKHIIIIGGGFAGLNLARKLFNNKFYQVAVIDKNNYNYFTPLLYQVETSFLEPSGISYPFRKIFKQKGIYFRMATVERVDPESSSVLLNDGTTLSYQRNQISIKCYTIFFAVRNRQNLYCNHTKAKVHQDSYQ